MKGLPWSNEALVRRAIKSQTTGFFPSYIEWASACCDAPLAYHVACGLSLLSSVVPAHFQIEGVPTCKRPNIFTIVVGRQGTERKSTAIDLAESLLNRAIEDKVGPYPKSPEGLVDQLVDTPQQLLVFSEMGQFFSDTQTRTGGNHAKTTKMILNKAYDGTSLSFSLSKRSKGGGIIRCDHHHLSILGGINPMLLSRLSEPEDWIGGLMSRFIIFHAHRERWQGKRRHNPYAEQQLADWLATAHQTPPELWGIQVDLTPEAYRLWRSYSRALEVTEPNIMMTRVFGAKSRTPDFAIKIAFLLEFSRGKGWPIGLLPGVDWLIEEDTMLAAIRLATIAYGSALAIMTSMTESRDMEHRQDVLLSVGADWTPLGQIINKCRHLKKRVLTILDSLETEGQIVRTLGTAPADCASNPHSEYSKGVPMYRRPDAADTEADTRVVLETLAVLAENYTTAMRGGALSDQNTNGGGSVVLPPAEAAPDPIVTPSSTQQSAGSVIETPGVNFGPASLASVFDEPYLNTDSGDGGSEG